MKEIFSIFGVVAAVYCLGLWSGAMLERRSLDRKAQEALVKKSMKTMDELLASVVVAKDPPKENVITLPEGDLFSITAYANGTFILHADGPIRTTSVFKGSRVKIISGTNSLVFEHSSTTEK